MAPPGHILDFLRAIRAGGHTIDVNDPAAVDRAREAKRLGLVHLRELGSSMDGDSPLSAMSATLTAPGERALADADRPA